MYHHSRRVFLWGSLQGRNRDLGYDPELLYVGAMFHDLGLNAEFRGSGRRFEVSSADEARRFLRGRGAPEDSIRRVWTAIALHTTPGVPEFMEPEVALVTAGVEYDVLGIGYHDISDADRAAVTALHPRPDFKRQILQAFTDGMAPRPDTTFGTMNADVLERFDPASSAATSWTSSRTPTGRNSSGGVREIPGNHEPGHRGAPRPGRGDRGRAARRPRRAVRRAGGRGPARRGSRPDADNAARRGQPRPPFAAGRGAGRGQLPTFG